MINNSSYESRCKPVAVAKKLGEPNTNPKIETIFIKDIQNGMKNLTLTCIVLEVGPAISLKENREVRTVKVADASACINLTVWDDMGLYITPSDILRVTKVYASIWRNSLTLYTQKTGTIEKIGEFCMVFNDQLNMSEIMPNPPVSGNNGPNGGQPHSSGTQGALHNRNPPYPPSTHGVPIPVPPHNVGPGSSRYDPRATSRNGQNPIEDPSSIPRNRNDRR